MSIIKKFLWRNNNNVNTFWLKKSTLFGSMAQEIDV